MKQSNLFDIENARFNAPVYVKKRDNPRLTGQIKRIYDLMKDGVWRTLAQIQNETGDGQASISAQLRHLRKERFGKHTVDRRHVAGGLFQYRLEVNDE